VSRETPRSRRLGDQIQRDLAELIRRELKDPRVGLVTITDVEVSRDLSHAKVYVSSLMESETHEQITAALQHAAGFLRARLGHALRVRQVPELHFVYDESVERGVRLSQLIDEAVESGGTQAPDGSPARTDD
jgi:ribosome-binding factor A